MSFDFNQWYSQVSNKDSFYTFRGTITGEVVTNILDCIEREFDKNNDSPKLRRKIYNIVVEVLQNLFHHVEEKLPEDLEKEFETKFVVFVINKKETFKITAMNIVKNGIVRALKDRIEQINSLTKDELKALYKIILNNQEFSTKGGGGLGLIDISRRAGTKLEYSFFPANAEYSFFIMEVNI